ncbi:MAG: TetR/AcrR family transcriptional regulator [Bacteroidetes bacterium]|nr:TetR/AcrR family transcriptional regulator [Bacteroidota bacterium]
MPKNKKFKREHILEIASNVFKQKGYNGTSVDDILKVAGLSRSSLYDSFGDKHSLYVQSLEYYKNIDNEKLGILNTNEANGLKKIEKLFEAVLNHLAENPNDNGCLLVNAAAEMSKQCFKTNQVICNNKSETEKLLTEWLENAQKNKEISLKKPVKQYSHFLYNTLCGLRVMSQSGADKKELKSIVDLTLSALN